MNSRINTFFAEGKAAFSATWRGVSRLFQWSLVVALLMAVVAFLGALTLASLDPGVLADGQIGINGFGINFDKDGFQIDGAAGGIVAFLALVLGLFVTIWALVFAAGVVMGSFAFAALVLVAVAAVLVLPLLALVLPVVWLVRRSARTSSGSAARSPTPTPSAAA